MEARSRPAGNRVRSRRILMKPGLGNQTSFKNLEGFFDEGIVVKIALGDFRFLRRFFFRCGRCGPGVEVNGFGLDRFVGRAGDEVVDDGASARRGFRLGHGNCGFGCSCFGSWVCLGCRCRDCAGEFGGVCLAHCGDDVAQSDLLKVLNGFKRSDFEMKTFVSRPLHAALGFGKGIDDGEETIRFIGIAGFGEIGPERFGKPFASGGRVELGHNERADSSDDFAEELGKVLAAFELFVDDFEGARWLLFENGLEEFGNGFAGGETKDVENVGFGDFVSAKGDELVEHRLGVAHAAVRSFCDGPGGGVVKFNSFFLRDVLQVCRDDVGGNRAEIEALTTRDDGRENLVGLGGGEDELYVLRRFFKGLEEGVEGGVREHVNLIDVVDLEAGAGGGEGGGFTEGAHLLDAVVGGSIDFEDVERTAFGDFNRERVFGVEFDTGSALGIEGFRENSGGGCFSGAAGADEEVSVCKTFLLDGITQGLDNVILSEDVVEGAGTVFSCKDLIAHADECREE